MKESDKAKAKMDTTGKDTIVHVYPFSFPLPFDFQFPCSTLPSYFPCSSASHFPLLSPLPFLSSAFVWILFHLLFLCSILFFSSFIFSFSSTPSYIFSPVPLSSYFSYCLRKYCYWSSLSLHPLSPFFFFSFPLFFASHSTFFFSPSPFAHSSYFSPLLPLQYVILCLLF